MHGVVIKNIADLFCLCDDSGKIYTNVVARGNLKKDEKVYVGDSVEFENDGMSSEKCVITSVHTRKNLLMRPPVANLDNLLICITREPAPDLVLVDKLIITCGLYGIEPILVISKADILDEQFVQDICEQYKDSVNHIVVLSSATGYGKEHFLSLIKHKTSSLVGQSAVGKSSIINMLGGIAKVGEISKKNLRGKNTTRHSEINLFGEGIRIADTSGFSRLALVGIKYTDLMRHYKDFLSYSSDCKYASCVHIFEDQKDCAIKRALNSGKINQNRYNRYRQIYDELKRQWDRRYD